MHFFNFLILQILVVNSIATNEEFSRFSGNANNLHHIERSDEHIKRGEFHILNESINNAFLMALQNCQQQMKWERWNCPEHDFQRYHKMRRTKEQGFMESLYAAAKMYNAISDCFQGKFSRCKCFKDRSSCSNCSMGVKDIMKFGRKIIKKYNLDSKKYRPDAVQKHNQKLGLRTVKEMLKWNETCLSKTKIIPFKNIARVLKTHWERATKMQDFNVPWFSNDKKFKKILNRKLTYIDPSPDYCIRNQFLKINGTEGRICLEKKYTQSIEPSQTKTCHRLCFSCGYNVNEKVTQFYKRCHCEKTGCCSVKCRICYTKRIIYFCTRK